MCTCTVRSFFFSRRLRIVSRWVPQLRDIKASVELEKDDIESPVITSVDERSLVDEQRGLVEQCENHFTTVAAALSAPGTPPDLSVFAASPSPLGSLFGFPSLQSSKAMLTVSGWRGFRDLLRKFEGRIQPKLSSNCHPGPTVTDASNPLSPSSVVAILLNPWPRIYFKASEKKHKNEQNLQTFEYRRPRRNIYIVYTPSRFSKICLAQI